MLAECKQALLRLLDFLEDDFSFDDLTVVFSGGRGYHVHVRDESVRELDSEARARSSTTSARSTSTQRA